MTTVRLSKGEKKAGRMRRGNRQSLKMSSVLNRAMKSLIVITVVMIFAMYLTYKWNYPGKPYKLPFNDSLIVSVSLRDIHMTVGSKTPKEPNALDAIVTNTPRNTNPHNPSKTHVGNYRKYDGYKGFKSFIHGNSTLLGQQLSHRFKVPSQNAVAVSETTTEVNDFRKDSRVAASDGTSSKKTHVYGLFSADNSELQSKSTTVTTAVSEISTEVGSSVPGTEMKITAEESAQLTKELIKAEEIMGIRKKIERTTIPEVITKEAETTRKLKYTGGREDGLTKTKLRYGKQWKHGYTAGTAFIGHKPKNELHSGRIGKSSHSTERSRLKNWRSQDLHFVNANRHSVLNEAETTDLTSERPDICTNCFQPDFPEMLNSPNLCSGDVDLLIVIESTWDKSYARKSIRKTWGEACNKKHSRIRCAFFFGNKNIIEANKWLRQESEQYKDVVQFDFWDSYANLTYKTLSALKWSRKYCEKAKYVMKTDDDVYVNTELLPHLIKAAPDNKFFGGHCWGASSPNRDTNSKWYVSFQQYSHPTLPAMCSGTGYIMSSDIVKGIVKLSANIPFFHLEDVYVAICVKQLHVRPIVLAGFRNEPVPFEACHYRNRVITSHGFQSLSLEKAWMGAQRCPLLDDSKENIYRGKRL